MVFEVRRKLFVSANGLGFDLRKGCKTVYSGSIPDVASTFEINDLGPPFQHWFSGRGMAPRTPRGNRSYGVPTTVVQ